MVVDAVEVLDEDLDLDMIGMKKVCLMVVVVPNTSCLSFLPPLHHSFFFRVVFAGMMIPITV